MTLGFRLPSGMKGQKKEVSEICSPPLKKPERAGGCLSAPLPHPVLKRPWIWTTPSKAQNTKPNFSQVFALQDKTNKQKKTPHTKKRPNISTPRLQIQACGKTGSSQQTLMTLRVSALSHSSTYSVTGRAGEMTGTLSFSEI